MDFADSAQEVVDDVLEQTRAPAPQSPAMWGYLARMLFVQRAGPSSRIGNVIWCDAANDQRQSVGALVAGYLLERAGRRVCSRDLRTVMRELMGLELLAGVRRARALPARTLLALPASGRS